MTGVDRLSLLANAQVRQGGVVTISAATAALLEEHCNLARLRVAHRGANPATDVDLLALRIAAMGHKESVRGTPESPNAAIAEPSSWVGTQKAADLLGLTARTIRGVIASGLLGGQKVGGRWVTTREDIENYRTIRTAA